MTSASKFRPITTGRATRTFAVRDACLPASAEHAGDPIVVHAAQDCVVSEDWAAWTPCSVSCGTGQRKRLQKVSQDRATVVGSSVTVLDPLYVRACQVKYPLLTVSGGSQVLQQQEGSGVHCPTLRREDEQCDAGSCVTEAEKAAKLAEEKAAKLAEEKAAKLAEEKAAKLAEVKAAKASAIPKTKPAATEDPTKADEPEL